MSSRRMLIHSVTSIVLCHSRHIPDDIYLDDAALPRGTGSDLAHLASWAWPGNDFPYMKKTTEIGDDSRSGSPGSIRSARGCGAEVWPRQLGQKRRRDTVYLWTWTFEPEGALRHRGFSLPPFQ